MHDRVGLCSGHKPSCSYAFKEARIGMQVVQRLEAEAASTSEAERARHDAAMKQAQAEHAAALAEVRFDFADAVLPWSTHIVPLDSESVMLGGPCPGLTVEQ